MGLPNGGGIAAAGQWAASFLEQLELQTEHLADIRSAVTEEELRDEFTRLTKQDLTSAAGALGLSFPFNLGYGVELISLSAVGTPNATYAVYMNDENSPGNLIAVGSLNAQGLSSINFAVGEYLPNGTTLRVIVAAGGNAVLFTTNIRFKSRRPTPARVLAPCEYCGGVHSHDPTCPVAVGMIDN